MNLRTKLSVNASESLLAGGCTSPTLLESGLTCIVHLYRLIVFVSYTDITRTLQQKQELIAKGKKQNALLAELNALDDSQKLSPLGEKVDVLVEPSGNLPLWRRVDRQFWWNEWLSKPFIDAGVSPWTLAWRLS